MAKDMETMLRVANRDSQGFLTVSEEYTNYPRSVEETDDLRRLPAGWWLTPAVALGFCAWALIVRSVWAWLT